MKVSFFIRTPGNKTFSGRCVAEVLEKEFSKESVHITATFGDVMVLHGV